MINKELKQKAIEVRKAYHRKWISEHKDRKRIYNQRYWEKKALQLKEDENNAKDQNN